MLNNQHHSDAGYQYTREAYKLEWTRRHARHEHGMSGVRKCYDNARIESFFCNAQAREAIPHKYDKIEKGGSKENHLEVYSCGGVNTPTLASGVLIVSYNRRRSSTMNPNGYIPAIYRELFEIGLSKPVD